ncbi:PD-(D/E)XK nuclease family protein [Candidatus Woesearchaeota archaeon]|nr:PD-(D/E)XK nuclease family protein [Candidatus Woesearchaeota archaeon]
MHTLKIAKLCKDNLSNLKSYLDQIFQSCPDKYFVSGPRSSALKFNIENLDIHEVNGHEVTDLAKKGLENPRELSAHSKVQLFMLERDNKTLAVEVPLWLHPEELETYEDLFNTTEPLTGHIDALRIEDNKIWIWDYKPGADKEKFAATQVYFYAYMLSKRTRIPLQEFRCGYFDDNTAFIFDPSKNDIQANY